MAGRALSIKLRCDGYPQLRRMHERDLSRGSLFLKSAKPPPLGTEVQISLTMPTGTTLALEGRVARHTAASDPRGLGVELLLSTIPASTMYLIESALTAAPAGRAPVKPPAPVLAETVVPARQEIPVEVDDPVDDAVEEPDTAAAEIDLVQALESELAGLRALNPFQVLGLAYEVSDAQVRAAFNELTKRYHPDRFARFESEAARALAGEIFILVREAYRKLGDAQSRATAVAAARGGARPTRSTTPPAGLPAPPLAAPARALPLAAPREGLSEQQLAPDKVLSFRQTGPQQPVRPAEAAGGRGGLSADDLFGDLAGAAARPGEPPPAAEVSQSSFSLRGEQLLDAGQYEEAFQAYDAASRSRPTDRAPRVGRELARGFQRLQDGDRMAAAQCFEAALEIDPMNERAARELAGMRRAATDARKGLLGRLLGKKD